MHLLKWKLQPEKRSSRWTASIRDSRKQIKRLLRDAPSLRGHMIEKFDLCYQDAVEDARDETGLSVEAFLPQCPWSLEQVLESEFLRLS
ncbi:MAG: DUF29 domain-containing protein [Thermosynechococcaceae cyanobacterium]